MLLDLVVVGLCEFVELFFCEQGPEALLLGAVYLDKVGDVGDVLGLGEVAVVVFEFSEHMAQGGIGELAAFFGMAEVSDDVFFAGGFGDVGPFGVLR